MAGVKDVQDSDSFKEIVRNNERCLCVFHFSATWAPQCTQMNEVMQELSKDSSYGSLKFYKLEAEDLPEISEEHGISAVPTFIFIRNGKVVDRLDGANAAEFTKKVKLLSSQSEVDKPDPPIAPKEDLNTKLKRLISSEDVMLFMKGTPSEPCCGFSQQIVQILNDNHIKYGSFNILEDEEVRQGLKTYSNWPTYPQLYSKGELIGGLDIVKELVENGELQLPKQVSLEDRLQALINEAPVMLFMKGDKDAPQCGFSKQAVAILNDAGANYKTFNILSNEEVRQGLKTFSDWPTYPQLYVNGELIGGLDIMKELKESGELKSILEKEK